MHSPYTFWSFILIFSFVWIMLYVSEPGFVKVDGIVSKKLCGWYAFTVAIVIALILWVVFYVLRWRQVKAALMAKSRSRSLSPRSRMSPLDKLEASFI